ncbi:putative 2-aminoethylphosphonate ABC transporter ATP-binding protein [Salinispirillum sp. LH 10-3-1]|uniref:2-aminoethylphosphonate ABC transporter ATP-binding protein n=1 Tax=Salinispirillum sp. LH 10-3-1 TaxID=2952525 RepID=A0AB38YJA3_9GAMM
MLQGSQLQLTGINKHFGQAHVLRDINLDIAPGELVCFLGPSGCGKTTLLRIIAGLEEQDNGTLIQGSKDISRLPVQQRDFGIVFQSYALFPNMTVAANIAFGLRCQKHSRADIRARVTELLALIRLEEHKNKYPAQLSGGQQQRVALARALAPSPGLLLLDEPLSALDARVRVHLRQEIRSLQQRLGVTTIMVTHDQEEALAMADRIVVMNEGVIEQVGTPLDIYTRPATPFVADFIGSMNFLDNAAEWPDLNLKASMSAEATEPSGVTLAIRPENVTLTRDHNSPLQGQVTAVEFMGSYLRCTVALSSSTQPLRADIDIQSALQLALKPGDRVGVTLHQNHLHCFAA